jgi:hypothetical protein
VELLGHQTVPPDRDASRPDRATIAELVKAIRWQIHSVRRTMSGALKKKLELIIETQNVEGRGRIYRIPS